MVSVGKGGIVFLDGRTFFFFSSLMALGELVKVSPVTQIWRSNHRATFGYGCKGLDSQCWTTYAGKR